MDTVTYVRYNENSIMKAVYSSDGGDKVTLYSVTGAVEKVLWGETDPTEYDWCGLKLYSHATKADWDKALAKYSDPNKAANHLASYYTDSKNDNPYPCSNDD